MSQNLIMLPVFAQVLLTLVVLMITGRARASSMRRRKQGYDDMALATEQDWDPPAIQAANNFKNQFELPVLFYAVTAFALITRNVDTIFFALAWMFVLARVVHTAIHVGANSVQARFRAYLAGFVMLVAMWLLLLWRVGANGF